MSKEASKPIIASQTPRKLVRKVQTEKNDIKKESIALESINSVDQNSAKTTNNITNAKSESQLINEVNENNAVLIKSNEENKYQLTRIIWRSPFNNTENNQECKENAKLTFNLQSQPYMEDKYDPDPVTEKRKLIFKPKFMPKSSLAPETKKPRLQKVFDFRNQCLHKDSGNPKETKELMPFTYFNNFSNIPSFPLYPSDNSLLNQSQNLKNPDLLYRIGALEKQLMEFNQNNIKSINSIGRFEPKKISFSNENSYSNSSAIQISHSKLINSNPQNSSGLFGQDYSNAKNNNFDNNKRLNFSSFNSDRKFKFECNTSINNNFSKNSFNSRINSKHKYHVELNLNQHFFNKLQNLLFKLKEVFIYDKLSNDNAFCKYRFWLNRYKSLKTIKAKARFWIMYRVKDYPSKSQYENPSLDNNKLSTEEWKILHCNPDGNCAFRALANQIYGRQSSHYKVRTEITDFMIRNKAHFSNFIDQTNLTFEDYIVKMKKNGTWGDNLEIDAASKLYHKPIFIYNFNKDANAYILRKSFCEEKDAESYPIRILYSENHYDALISKIPEFMPKNRFGRKENFHVTKKNSDANPPFTEILKTSQ